MEACGDSRHCLRRALPEMLQREAHPGVFHHPPRADNQIPREFAVVPHPALALLASARMIRALPHRSGAESPIAPNKLQPQVCDKGLYRPGAPVQRKSLWILEPFIVITESGTLSSLSDTKPQAPHQMWGVVEIHVNEDLLVHRYFSTFALLVLRGRISILFGRRSSSSARPTSSD
jgi:hypothetical protein